MKENFDSQIEFLEHFLVAFSALVEDEPYCEEVFRRYKTRWGVDLIKLRQETEARLLSGRAQHEPRL